MLLFESQILLSVGEVLDGVNAFFWIIFGVLIIIGVIRVINNKAKATNSKNSEFSKSRNNLLPYLINRIETAGKENNLMQNDSLLSPMGFIGAIECEKKNLKSQTREIAHEFCTTEQFVYLAIDDAFEKVYHKYIE